ncbi:MAG: HlyC/CorC family transporter [Candidatus Marinimicrobia bacterium]|nr:HlyC/CorC family transporter [Candidatus Neomarinimicrobiota bacterium]
MDLTIYFILLFLLLLLSGFFSGSETALFSLSDYQKELLLTSNEKKGKLIKNLLDKPRKLIITILLGNEFVNISISTITAGLIIHLFDKETPWINIAIVLPVLLLFGEITPKTIALRNNIQFSSFVASPLTYFQKIITPVQWFIKNISDVIVNLFVRKKSRQSNILTEDVVKELVSESEMGGQINSSAKKYINNIFDFGDTLLTDIMTPRSNIFALPDTLTVSEIIDSVKKVHHSNVPIYQGDLDNIKGMILTTDLIGLSDKEIANSEETLAGILREPYFVPENLRADELFKNLKSNKISVAITLDEYGGVTGIVTIEDLLEKIFGEIYDEYDNIDKHYQKISENIFTVSGEMLLEEFNEVFQTRLENEGMETIGGFVFTLFGKLPDEKSIITYQNIQFQIETIRSNKILKLRLKIKK